MKLRRTPPPAQITIDEPSVDGPGARRRIVLSASSLIVSNIAVAVLAVATVHITAQHLGGKEFGHFTTVTSFVAMLGLLVDLGVTSVTARDVAKDVPHAGDIIGQALTFRLSLCLIVAPILAGAAFLLYPQERGSVGLGVALMTVDLFFVSMQAVVQAYYSGLVRNQVPALLLMICKVLYFAGVLIVAHETHGSIIPFIIAYLVADGIISVISVASVRRRIKIKLHWSPRGWWGLAVIAVPLGAMQVVNRLYSRLDSVLLSLLRGPVDVGQYGIAFYSPSGPIQVWVCRHQKIPSLVGGTVGSDSVAMNCPFQRSAGHNSSRSVSKRSASRFSIMRHLRFPRRLRCTSEWRASLRPWPA